MTKDRAARLIPTVRAVSLFAVVSFFGSFGLMVVALYLAMYWLRNNPPASPLYSIAQAISQFIFVPIILASLVSYIVSTLWYRRTRRLARAADYCLCIHCCYNLAYARRADPASSPVSPSVRCPECGCITTLANTQLLWRTWLRVKTADATPPQ